MVKEMTILCDFCREKRADVKCFICSKDICKDHNFGGEHSYFSTDVAVYSDHIFKIEVEDNFMNCCPDCTTFLNKIMIKNRDVFENKIKENMTTLKIWLLDEIKKMSESFVNHQLIS